MQRLQRHASKRIAALTGDAQALEVELNKLAGAPADKPIMLEGKFRRSGLTNEAILVLDGALRMAGV